MKFTNYVIGGLFIMLIMELDQPKLFNIINLIIMLIGILIYRKELRK